MSAPITFEVADRVRVIHAGWTGSVVAIHMETELGMSDIIVDVLLDGQGLSGPFRADELEPYDGPSVEPEPPVVAPPARPIRDGLPGVGDALLNVAAVLGAQLADNPVVQAKLAELQAAVESAMPPVEISDDAGNGWKLCGPGCDLTVVDVGQVTCTRAGGCTR